MFEIVVEESRIKHKVRIFLQELHSKLPCIALLARRKHIAFRSLYRLYVKQTLPFLMLLLVGAYFFVERFGHTVERDAVVALHHKLLLQPQLLLEVFKSGKHLYNLFAHGLDGLRLGKRAAKVVVVEVRHVHYLVLQIEVELTAKEIAKILVYEIVA